MKHWNSGRDSNFIYLVLTMRKTIICLFVLITSFSAFSQTKIESVGQAALSVKPDIGVLSLSLTSIKPDVSASVEDLNAETSQITKQLSKLNLDDFKLSTANFAVRLNRIFDQRGKFRDSGYVATQRLIVEFKNTKENIAKVLSSFSGDYSSLNFSFSFKASDALRASTEKRIAELATKDAIEKAGILAGTAKLSLGKILEIKHGRFAGGNPPITLSGGLNEVVYSSYGGNQGFEAQDLMFTDSVLVIVELK
jgi:uncharacterized protein